jgi:acyl transferase domain-containing protein
MLEGARPVNAEPLAVIGIGCRFPGGESPRQFWRLLQEGRSGISAAPPGRWPRFEASAGTNDLAGGPRTLRAGFLDDVDLFDARFFGISPREADQLDPQQRLLLEVVWQTFEDACIPIDQLAGSQTGVFVGASSNDYLRLQSSLGLDVSGYSATGNSLAVIANRISYTFDFHGPSWTVDTACSSSLVAVHQACSSLRRGECDLAIAGGVSLILSPDATDAFIKAGMLSPGGECRTFAATADGFVRGEGCGAVLIKPLSRAISDGDRIYCVLRGSAVNQDGRSNGLTAPSGMAQQAVIRAALAEAAIEAEQVEIVEAHGTGTLLGDPIEFSSLGAAYAPNGQRRRL